MGADGERKLTVERRKPRRKRKVTVIVLIVTVVVLFFSELWGVGVICPKCLPGASITQLRLGKVPIFQWTRYESHLRLNPSWSGSEFTFPNQIQPEIHQEIFGKKCRHKMKKDGCGAGPALFFLPFGGQSDGALLARGLYQPRIEAVAVLYSLFRDVPSKRLAQRTYALIDSMLLIDREQDLYDVRRISQLRETGTRSEEEIRKNWPAAFPLCRSVEQLKLFTTRLRGVTSEEEWTNLLDDVDGQSKRREETEQRADPKTSDDRGLPGRPSESDV